MEAHEVSFQVRKTFLAVISPVELGSTSFTVERRCNSCTSGKLQLSDRRSKRLDDNQIP